MHKDDYIIAMDLWPDQENGARRMDYGELCKLRDTGVKTVLTFIPWFKIEDKSGAIDWSETFDTATRYKRAGLKGLFVAPDMAPQHYPIDWYQKSWDGTLYNDVKKTGWSIFSPWNKDAQKRLAEFVVAAKRVLQTVGNDMQAIASLGREGESILVPQANAFHDNAAIAEWNEVNGGAPLPYQETGWGMQADTPVTRWLQASLTDFYVKSQSLYQENWTMLHRAYGWDAGCFIDSMMGNLAGPKYGIQFTHFPHGPLMQRTLADMRKHNITMWAGSEYPEGIVKHVHLAISQGLQGLLTAPIYPGTRYTRVDNDVIKLFQYGMAAFKNARGNPGQDVPCHSYDWPEPIS